MMYFANDNGQITCEEHAGRYLSQALEVDRTASQHWTPLGTWLRLTPADVAELGEALETTTICETCRR